MARGRVKTISGHRTEWLSSGWEFTSCPADAVADPTDLEAQPREWLPAAVPCTVAGALRAAGRWSLDGPARRFDADDWWFRCTFRTSAPAVERLWLCFDGLATLADVWLNGERLLQSHGMFSAHECRVDRQLAASNTLVIRFRSLDAALRARRPRPRWRTPMVEHQQLRWFRTTLLGRTPGWSPPAAPVGPWRAIRLERRPGIDITDVRLGADADGRIVASVDVDTSDGRAIDHATLVLERAGRVHRLRLTSRNETTLELDTVVPGVEPWWPHTHGVAALYTARLEIQQGASVTSADLGAVGFRTVTLESTDGDFRIRVNGAPVFCRGACWTPLDVVSLESGAEALDEAFNQLVAAGMNMVRLGGQMIYESDAFLDRCDAHGVLLWQDFMFANMDYPEDDPAFLAEVTTEARQMLGRLQGRPSAAILCGNSEGGQQPAMWGAPRPQWFPPLFHESLASLAREHCPQVPYWPSSTHGGAFPHQASAGSGSYYGVGAYLRPIEDARRAEVRFASECLAFANIPEESTLARVPSPHRLRMHHAVWKTRAPRDLGAGWDFDDVRDHYLERLFAVNPLTVRYADHERYLDLGRVVTGEIMAGTFLEWRRARSVTRGGLVWFLRDLWPGAGWGVIGADGIPKAAWYYLRRALAPLALGLTDEGGNGLAVHVINDHAQPFAGTLELELWRAGEVRVGAASTRLTVAGRTATELNAVALFDGFQDLNYAYRFGPPPHDLVAATLRDSSGALQARAVHFIGHWPAGQEKDVGLAAAAEVAGRRERRLTVHTRRFAQAVHINVAGFLAEDNYFHLLPGEERTILLRPGRPAPADAAGHAVVRALNSELTVRVAVP